MKDKVDQARTFGLNTEADFTRYNDLALAEGEYFPEAGDLEILENQDFWGWQKLDQLESIRIFSNGHPTS